MSAGAQSESALARVRHDMRTPINHILGYSELVAEELADEGVTSVAADLEKIRNAAQELLRMVGEHLSDDGFARLGSGLGPETPSAPASGQTVAKFETHSDARAAVTGRILVVDDNLENRETLARRLQRQGHSTTMAADGAEALEIARREPFDLVLLDVLMPVLDGYGALAAFKADEALRHIPVIMISALDEIESVVHCIEEGAEDYLPKPFNPTLLRARIGASLEKKALRDQEQKYLRRIEETQRHLKSELDEAANYVRSIFPQPTDEPFRIDWNYAPSMELGGDAFGYHWIDGEHLAIYLLDVCGHGVGASLLSVSAINVLRSGSLPETNFRDPAAVLAGLNNAFPMERQNNMYFTIWYGVYHSPTRILRHASGGHPPSLLLVPGGAVRELRAPGMLIGVMPDIGYASDACEIEPGSRLLVLCDGTYEIKRPDGTMIEFDDFKNFMQENGARPDGLERLLAWVRQLRGGGALEDDFSILRVQF
ncbi:MAG: SpoIIE family protein phosphatase [Terrimicrobiaceae bacterium]|nr:SpoIIE family protein phosphatase [Terrimicrobiaceae bacterium]